MNTTTTLYRVEEPGSRLGPYSDTTLYERIADSELTEELYFALYPMDDKGWMHTHPIPDDDGLDRWLDPTEQCAFASLEQLFLWWTEPGTLDVLQRAGYVLYEMEVYSDKVIHLGHQSIFDSGAVVSRKVLDTSLVLV